METRSSLAGSTKRWQLRMGLAVLILSIALPLGGVLFSFLGWRGMQSAFIAFLLVGGLPEILCLLAIAVLGKEHYASTVSAVRRTRSLPSVSRMRYYSGLIGCLLNGVPIWLYAYTPWLMPEGSNKFIILATADLVFIFSIFLMGGEFWEKFRRLFVWEGST